MVMVTIGKNVVNVLTWDKIHTDPFFWLFLFFCFLTEGQFPRLLCSYKCASILWINTLLNWPTRHRSRVPRGQGAPGLQLLYKVKLLVSKSNDYRNKQNKYKQRQNVTWRNIKLKKKAKNSHVYLEEACSYTFLWYKNNYTVPMRFWFVFLFCGIANILIKHYRLFLFLLILLANYCKMNVSVFTLWSCKGSTIYMSTAITNEFYMAKHINMICKIQNLLGK